MSVQPSLPDQPSVAAQPTGAPPTELDAALARLVARGVLTPEQAQAVRTETGTPTSEHGHPARPGVRARLVEVAAYLGAVLVAASVVAFIADSWDELSEAARLALLGGSGLVAAVAGVLVAVTVPGGRRSLRLAAHAARRRVSSALMALGAVLLAVTATQVLDGVVSRPELAGPAVALALLVGAQLLAPSAITEIGMLGSTLLLAGMTTEVAIPDVEPDWDAVDYVPPAEEYVIPAVIAVVGFLWASLVSRLLTLPVVATALGCAAALLAAFVTATGYLKGVGLGLLAALAVAGLLMFLRVHLWPWLALTVLSLTLFVFVVVAEQSAPALAFLVAGLVLLGGALGAALLGRRATRRAEVAAPPPEAEPQD